MQSSINRQNHYFYYWYANFEIHYYNNSSFCNLTPHFLSFFVFVKLILNKKMFCSWFCHISALSAILLFEPGHEPQWKFTVFATQKKFSIKFCSETVSYSYTHSLHTLFSYTHFTVTHTFQLHTLFQTKIWFLFCNLTLLRISYKTSIL